MNQAETQKLRNGVLELGTQELRKAQRNQAGRSRAETQKLRKGRGELGTQEIRKELSHLSRFIGSLSSFPEFLSSKFLHPFSEFLSFGLVFFRLRISALLLLAGCATVPPIPTLQRCEFRSPHMGTLFTITLYAPDSAVGAAAADAAFQRVAVLERMMTDYDPESELMRLSRSPVSQPVPVSPDLFAVLARSQELSALSGGAFDVTIGPSVRLWRRARRTGALPADAALQKAHAAVGWQKLRLDAARQTITLLATNMQLDLGGIAKGYAADAALKTLRAARLPRALVAASGDLAIGDAPPGERGWRVGVGVPDTTDAQLSRQLLLANAAVSTSGDTEQSVEIAGQRYSHIVNPHTGLGLTNRLQATIIARHTTDTDALATTVCVLGLERGLALIRQLPHTSALVIGKRGDKWEVLTSGRLPGASGSNAYRLRE